MTVTAPARAWVERCTGSAVRTARRFTNASTAAVHAIALVDGRRLVLRRYVWPWFLDDEPEAPRREADALAFAWSHGLAVPEVLAADPTGGEVGDGVPALLMTRVRGRPVPVPDLGQLAAVVASIHAVDATRLGHEYFPWCVDTMVRPPGGARRPDLWERAIRLRRNGTPDYRPVFVHRDFHPGNVLWWRGRCSGVVDWVDACGGPAGCDVAHCRDNLTPPDADAFLGHYEALTGTTHHPYWEIASTLEHEPSHWKTPDDIAAAEARLGAALSALT